jgi:SagB-type dehydrogenase family enzyme
MVHPSQQDFCRLWGQLVSKAWADAAFKERLVTNPVEVLKEHGYELPPGMKVDLRVVASDDKIQYLYVPCRGELLDESSSTEAGEVASDCLNNRVVLARLAAEAQEGKKGAGQPVTSGGWSLSASLVLGLRDGVSLTLGAKDEFVLEGAGVRFVFGQLGDGARAALHRLATAGEEEGRLADLVEQEDGPHGLMRLYYFLHRLAQRGLLVRSVKLEGQRLATLIPTSPSFVYTNQEVTADRMYVLSRFAYTRRQEREMVLESPLAQARVVLHDGRVASLLHALTQPGRAGDLSTRCPVLSPDAIAHLLTLLVNTKVLVELSDGITSREDVGSALQTWEFHDLLFHARSRNGRHDQPVGGTCRFLNRLAPPPALKSVGSEQMVELYRPDLELLKREDPPFAEVQEARSSVRFYSTRPISDRQLGEFLYRVARVKQHREVEVQSPQPFLMEVALRPYPGGGALHELEIYAVINSCEGLLPGLYHYDPLDHRMGLLSGRTPYVEELLRYAALSVAIPQEQLQVLLVIAARFPRVAWKYSSVAYALVLKDVGVVLQTMYLAATAMGLAPCALGGGDADVFARAAGLDYYAETSVGEFLLGSKL